MRTEIGLLQSEERMDEAFKWWDGVNTLEAKGVEMKALPRQGGATPGKGPAPPLKHPPLCH
jgi:hypothetical protein